MNAVPVPPNPGLDLNEAQWLLLLSILKAQVPGLAVCAFGSRVRGQAKAFSDLDLMLMTDQPLAPDKLAALREAFSESDLPFKVDLVDWSSTSDSFRAIVQRELMRLPTSAQS